MSLTERRNREAAGQWLRQQRMRRGFDTVGSFARAIGVDTSRVSSYETGRSSVPDDRADRIAEVLGLDIIEVRRNLGLWVPPEPGEEEPDETELNDDVLTPAEREVIEMIRTDPRVRRRFFDAVLAGHGQLPPDQEPQEPKSPGQQAS